MIDNDREEIESVRCTVCCCGFFAISLIVFVSEKIENYALRLRFVRKIVCIEEKSIRFVVMSMCAFSELDFIIIIIATCLLSKYDAIVLFQLSLVQSQHSYFFCE